MKSVDYYWDLLEELDAMPHQVTDWEAEFISGLLERRENGFSRLSEKQRAVIIRLEEKYLL